MSNSLNASCDEDKGQDEEAGDQQKEEARWAHTERRRKEKTKKKGKEKDKTGKDMP